MLWSVKRASTARVIGWACLLGSAISPCFGQSLGEVARNERARRQSQPAVPHHVYTNEDLVRPQILLPEDRARIKASRIESTEPSVATQVPPAPPKSDETPLGDVARYYRLMKQVRDLQQQGITPGLGGETVLGRLAASFSTPKIEPAANDAHAAPVVAPTAGSIPAPPGNDAPLGDVARYYQWVKEAREAQRKAAAAATPSNADLGSSSSLGPPLAPVASPGNHRPPSGLSRAPRRLGFKPPCSVRVARGESLWTLARRYLGSGARWRELAALNPRVIDPRGVRVGEWIRLPDLSSLPRVARTVRVRKGDTLWKIAATELGSGLAWPCIARANPDLADANFILPEQALNVPTGCRVSSRP
jgi:nucleoid-associated protein YgaU